MRVYRATRVGVSAISEEGRTAAQGRAPSLLLFWRCAKAGGSVRYWGAALGCIGPGIRDWLFPPEQHQPLLSFTGAL